MTKMHMILANAQAGEFIPEGSLVYVDENGIAWRADQPEPRPEERTIEMATITLNPPDGTIIDADD